MVITRNQTLIIKIFIPLPLKLGNLTDFIKCYNPDSRSDRKEPERFKTFGYDELIHRDKVSLDIFWIKDEHRKFSESARAANPRPRPRGRFGAI
jgi:hypothetical protein